MKEDKKIIFVIVIIVLLIVGIAIGISYAWWSSITAQQSVNKITSDCLRLELVNDKNEINIASAYPIRDSEVQDLVPYEFTIQNVCNLDVEYTIHLEMLKNEIGSEFIGISLNDENKRILGNLEEINVILDGVEARKIASGKRLNAKESAPYTLKLWIDQSVTLEDNIQNKSFEAKVILEGLLAETKSD